MLRSGDQYSHMSWLHWSPVLGIPSGKYLKWVPHVWEKKKWCIFAIRVGFHAALWKFHSAGTYVTSSQHIVTCLNFAVTESRILLPAVSSFRRVKPSRKIALNSNGEVNYRELARRPWLRVWTIVYAWRHSPSLKGYKQCSCPQFSFTHLFCMSNVHTSIISQKRTVDLPNQAKNQHFPALFPSDFWRKICWYLRR